MPHDTVRGQRTNTFLKILIAVIVIGGISARLWVYLQNRNLIIDEANVARNLFERGFTELLQPLNYEQYAPPIFLWIEKINTILFGFHEYALRLYPLLAGIAAIFVMLAILRHLTSLSSLWYPLILFCAPHILIRYCSEVKQYMPDVLITFSLILLALKIRQEQFSRVRFIITWSVVGSVAIWSCMPSVFILAGIGAHYGLRSLKAKNYRNLVDIALISSVWLAQFAFYYVAILKAQANSDYLQNFHQYNFLFATPDDASEWVHNWAVVNALIRQVGGWPYTLVINTILILIGTIAWLRNDTASSCLVIVPLTALMVAAALNQYSLLPRVALFSIPLFIILIGYGFYVVMRVDSIMIKIAATTITVYCFTGCIVKTARSQFRFEQLTDGMQFVENNGVPPYAVYLHHASIPALIYYTEMHPNASRWVAFRNANRVNWDIPYSAIGKSIKDGIAPAGQGGFIFTNATPEMVDGYAGDILPFLKMKTSWQLPGVRVLIFER